MPLRVHIRCITRLDMDDVLRIEHESFEFPWAEDDFLSCLRQRNCIGMVAEHDRRIVGFMIYELHKSKLHILNFAVCRDCQRQKVGSQMVGRLIDKLSQQRRQEITLEVRETNLAAQLFCRRNGFSAIGIYHSYYMDTDEDAYVMRYRLADEFDPLRPGEQVPAVDDLIGGW